MTRSLRLVCLTALTLAAIPLSAQAKTEAALDTPTLPHNGRITGTVLCADTHLPARGAVVAIQGLPSTDGGMQSQNASGSTITASDGTYSIGSLPSGRYTAIVVLPGYLTEMHQALQDAANMVFRHAKDTEAIHTGEPPVRTLWLGDGQTLQFDVLLQRGSALSGHIRYPDGAPASQVMLMLEDGTHVPATDNETRMEQNIMANVESQFTKQSLRPDDRGWFRLFGLQPGKYRLAVLQPSNHETRNGRDGVQVTGDHGGVSPDPYATRFYAGNTTHNAKAEVFDLHPGEEISDIDITLPLNAFHTIRGSIRATDGRIPNGALLALVDTTDPASAFSAATEDDGTFRFPQVPAGSYRLTCDHATISKTVPLPAPSGGEREIYTNAFAAQTLLVNVSSDDVNNVEFSLQEIPLTDELKYINALPIQ
jgi:hypothetical protein